MLISRVCRRLSHFFLLFIFFETVFSFFCGSCILLWMRELPSEREEELRPCLVCHRRSSIFNQECICLKGDVCECVIKRCQTVPVCVLFVCRFKCVYWWKVFCSPLIGLLSFSPLHASPPHKSFFLFVLCLLYCPLLRPNVGLSILKLYNQLSLILLRVHIWQRACVRSWSHFSRRGPPISISSSPRLDPRKPLLPSCCLCNSKHTLCFLVFLYSPIKICILGHLKKKIWLHFHKAPWTGHRVIRSSHFLRRWWWPWRPLDSRTTVYKAPSSTMSRFRDEIRFLSLNSFCQFSLEQLLWRPLMPLLPSRNAENKINIGQRARGRWDRNGHVLGWCGLSNFAKDWIRYYVALLHKCAQTPPPHTHTEMERLQRSRVTFPRQLLPGWHHGRWNCALLCVIISCRSRLAVVAHFSVSVIPLVVGGEIIHFQPLLRMCSLMLAALSFK